MIEVYDYLSYTIELVKADSSVFPDGGFGFAFHVFADGLRQNHIFDLHIKSDIEETSQLSVQVKVWGQRKLHALIDKYIEQGILDRSDYCYEWDTDGTVRAVSCEMLPAAWLGHAVSSR